MKNGIHVYVDPSTLQTEVGHIWIPLPETGIADLAPEIADVLRPACGSHDFKPPSNRDLRVPVATWEAVLARAAEIVAANVQLAKEKAAREEREKAERAERTVKWREAAARYLAGEDVSVVSGFLIVDGVQAAETDVPESERREIRDEIQRRRELYEAKERAEREARAFAEAEKRLAILAARAAWLKEYGYEEAAERASAGVLSETELRRFLHCHAPAVIGIPRYQKRTVADIDHRDDCEEDAQVSWNLDVIESVECSAEMWARLKATRAFYADVPNTKIEIREHEAQLSCRCPDPVWYGVLVTILYPEMDISIGIEYDLGQ